MTTIDPWSSGAVRPKGSLRSIGRRGAVESRTSMALILTLAMIVLITVLIVAFYTYATANREIENSRASQVKAEQLARSGLDYVTANFIQEITTNSYSTSLITNGVTIYRPINSTNIVPIRTINSSLSGNTNFYNLIRQSISAADANASSDGTATPSENGRLVSMNRWNAPVLNVGSGFTTTSQLPNWIYVNKTTGIATVTTANSTGVIGRFAYNVYDISGLLDANVAGFPSNVATSSMTASSVMKTTPAGQGTVAGADLTVLGASQSAVDMLRTNFCAPNGDPNYTNQVWAAAQNGFLSNITTYTNYATGTVSNYTNSLFINRQDLLRYVQTTNTALANALPYLTAFSRTLNAPSWGPTINAGTGYNYQSIEDATTSTNRFIPNVRYYQLTDSTGPSQTPQFYTHYNDDGTYTTNFVNAGDPLIQRRFSLAKLAWLTASGPNTNAFNASIRNNSALINQAILYCFGLQWSPTWQLNNNKDGNDPADPAWVYIGNDGFTTVRSSIDTLDQVAQGNREPTFFELLKAGILSGSLGKSGYTSNGQAYGVSDGGIYQDDTNSDCQVIRIGANLIDQYKSDGYPTAIAFATATGSNPQAYTFWGIEDLPYLQQVGVYALDSNAPPSTVTTPSATNGPVYNYIFYQLWNPHALTTNIAYASSLQGPSNFRVRIATDGSPSYPQPNFNLQYYEGPSFLQQGSGPQNFNQTNEPPITFSVNFTNTTTGRLGGTAQQSYREPHVIRDSTSTNYNSILQCNPTVLPPYTTYGILFQPNTNPPPGWYAFHYQFTDTAFVLDYQATNGNWYPYTSFVGHEEGGPGGGFTAINANINIDAAADTNTSPYTSSFATGSHTAAAGYGKEDPRTYRFDAHWEEGFDGTLRGTTNSITNSVGYTYNYPPFLGTPNVTYSLPAYLALNNTNFTYAPSPSGYYADNDGIVRLGDDYWGGAPTNGVNPYGAGTNMSPAYTYRPVILNHPFTSVADMGYAFRDLPFKTLDFFSQNSADAALLDLFCLHDEPAVVAGQVNLNTAQSLVQQSLLTNAPGVAAASVPTLTANYQAYAFNSSRTPTTSIPLNAAQLSKFLDYNNNAVSATDTKSNLEAPVRSLSSVVQTRTWNLLIDVVAQVGTYPPGATPAAGSFIVQGEKRYWLSIAIDRYTGQIVDQQLESVNE